MYAILYTKWYIMRYAIQVELETEGIDSGVYPEDSTHNNLLVPCTGPGCSAGRLSSGDTSGPAVAWGASAAGLPREAGVEDYPKYPKTLKP